MLKPHIHLKTLLVQYVSLNIFKKEKLQKKEIKDECYIFVCIQYSIKWESWYGLTRKTILLVCKNFYIKNSCVEWDSVSHALGGRSKQLISITLKPRILGSVTISPRGWYTRSFCSATNFDTFRRHCNKTEIISKM